ncbi:MAG: hypothetical protein A2284_17165 [Deltaproteobacteria bacterium RIFOXYA12_FULL_61_11]|nr:MAG: hypothetical protein A2284_17165 [Deltaproteobacteria bacterium RIFOXYA12_FULL_61_11]
MSVLLDREGSTYRTTSIAACQSGKIEDRRSKVGEPVLSEDLRIEWTQVRVRGCLASHGAVWHFDGSLREVVEFEGVLL